MGLLDDTYAKAKALAGLLADAYQTGAQAYFPNEEDVKARPELAKGLLQFVPGPGDAISGYDAMQSAKRGNYGEAALNGIGLLPFVPSMAGMAPIGATVPVTSKSGRLMEVIDLPWAKKSYGDSKTYVIRPKTNENESAIKEGTLSITKDRNGYHINTVVVDPASRNDGLASLMLQRALYDSGGLYDGTGFSGAGLGLANKFGMTLKDGKRFIPSP